MSNLKFKQFPNQEMSLGDALRFIIGGYTGPASHIIYIAMFNSLKSAFLEKDMENIFKLMKLHNIGHLILSGNPIEFVEIFLEYRDEGRQHAIIELTSKELACTIAQVLLEHLEEPMLNNIINLG